MPRSASEACVRSSGRHHISLLSLNEKETETHRHPIITSVPDGEIIQKTRNWLHSTSLLFGHCPFLTTSTWSQSIPSLFGLDKIYPHLYQMFLSFSMMAVNGQSSGNTIRIPDDEAFSILKPSPDFISRCRHPRRLLVSDPGNSALRSTESLLPIRLLRTAFSFFKGTIH